MQRFYWHWIRGTAALLSFALCAAYPFVARAHASRSLFICAMTRTEVRSSAIEAVGYDEVKKILEIRFHDGDIYHFFLVPPSVHRAMLRAKSKGKYYNKHIIRRYKYRRIVSS